jgi:peptidoglycan/LPS O-acetylase OafA/YrhL
MNPPRIWQLVRERAWPESGALSTIPALDGLRAVAVLLVLAFHSWYKVPGYLGPGQTQSNIPLDVGHTGVHLFFVLSGFLLFLPYARWLFGLQGRPSSKLFYRRRILRVGPAYWVSLCVLLLASPHLSRLLDVAIHATFFQNLWSRSTYSLDGVFYTMAVEVQFYLVLPLLGWLAFQLSRRWGARTGVGLLAAGMVVVALLDKALSATSLAGLPIVGTALLTMSSLPYWLAVFAAGIVASVIYVYLTAVRPPAPQSLARMGTVMFVVGLGLWLLPVVSSTIRNSQLPIYGLAYAAILFGVVCGARPIVAVFASRPLRFIGLVSYSLYIWHLGVLKVVDIPLRNLPVVPHVALRFLLVATVGVGVAYISYQLTERPFMSARRRSHEGTSRSEPAVPLSEPSVRTSVPQPEPAS